MRKTTRSLLRRFSKGAIELGYPLRWYFTLIRAPADWPVRQGRLRFSVILQKASTIRVTLV